MPCCSHNCLACIYKFWHTKCEALGVIARELALDLADASYAVDFLQHVAGVANVTADTFSRKWQPDKRFATPSLLTEAGEVKPPVRSPKWWRNWMHDHSHHCEDRLVLESHAGARS